MLRHAPHLRTIEIAFPKAPLQPLETVADLSRLSVQRSRWPNLERLQLQWFSTSDRHLRGFLTAHATPVTSLALSHINLRPHVSNGKIHDSFWVGFILFLRESLNLHEMYFLNSLTNEGNENWNIVEPTLAAWADTPQVREDLSFKQRVERYVMNGGEFLLPLPIETNDKSHWETVLRDFRPKLDRTWYWNGC